MFRLVLGSTLLAGYLIVPLFIKSSDSKEGVLKDPDKVNRIEIAGFAGGDVALVKKDESWILENAAGVQADSFVVSSLLSALAGAETEPAEGNVPADNLALTLKGDGEDLNIRLGQRIVPFRKQLVEIDGQVAELSTDVSACLGQWQSLKPSDTINSIIKKCLVDVRVADISDITLKTPINEVTFKRGAVASETDEGVLYNWMAGADASANKINNRSVNDFVRDLSKIVVIDIAGKEQVANAKGLPYLVEMKTEDGDIAFRVSERMEGSSDCLFKMEKPMESGEYIIKGFTGRKIFPAGNILFSDLDRVNTRAGNAVAVRYERDGKTCRLKRTGNKSWKVVEPKTPYKVYLPPKEPGMPHENMAQSYLGTLKTFQSRHACDLKDPAVKKIMADAFRNPAAEVSVQLKGGEVLAVTCSRPIPETELIFVRVNGETVVLNESFIEQCAPHVAYFFDPSKVTKETLEW